ncbi:N-acetylmuramoyl-L-alanine amidase [Streptomyces somaliensis DSM 40738]|uniref:N-acetylmuramoyl-L-alanine amidase n=1 Tax=Streptomyces somaliensis TaxID=78355 RepID=UPI0021C264FC|nr:N-acetylmuramoyl-L-alanine amidase [Streptomyces somaliensis]MCQ0022400.1 N-acetylmuramoyl-L-alanine amidase [Streptomyces somaliensis DSM 40738]
MHGIASVVAVATTAGALAVASPGVPGAPAAAAAAPGTELQARFEEAAREFGVPVSVLMAVAYRQTRWESHGGRPSTTGAYNVMGLTRVGPEDLEDPEDGHGGGDDEHRLAHMNRSGDPEVERRFDAERALKSVRGKPVDTDDPRLHTLDEAARLAGASPDAVRVDPRQSVRAGAALLAEYQRRATGSLPDEPDGWYPAVARYSQAPDRRGARLFAERVFESIRTGERRTTGDGQRLSLPADPSVRPVRPSRVPLAAAPATAATSATAPAPDCPAGLDCDFRPAAYEQNSGPDDWGNYTVAGRPANGQDIRYIVIHDTEGGYAGSLSVFQNPGTYASAHYLIRASDGLVTQMVENRNEAWHAGNKTLNTHSIGIEHEGYAIKEGSWYTEPQYESSAALVRHLAAKYRIPLDREHVIGHDEVPGALDTKVRPMHWDPGPFWDWNHYMALMGAPTGAGGAGGPLRAGQLVRFVPPFTRANQPKLTNGGAAVTPRPANLGYLYTSPSTGSATVGDPYLGAQTWSEGWNWGNKLVAGGTYVVAEARNDWTAIWHGGRKAWFRNPGGQYTAPVRSGTVLRAGAGATVEVYGRGYPEDAAYAGTGVPVPDRNGAHLTRYALPAGQLYASAGAAVPGTYYHRGTFDGTGPGSRTLVRGKNSFRPVRYNHRLAWVDAADVEGVAPTAPDPGTDRHNVLARDGSGVLWQYQGTGGGTSPFFVRYRVGGGWGAYDLVTPMTALRADGRGDAVARDRSGHLWYHRGSGNPSAPFAARLHVGRGWQVYDLVSGARDLTGDGLADLVARDGSGRLWLYRGTGLPSAPFAVRVPVGRGWQVYRTVTGTGDLTGDGRPDLVARDGDGGMWLYRGTGSAAAPFAARLHVGGGWQGYDALLGPGDLNRDGRPDLVARDGGGRMWLYRGTGSAASPFAARTAIGGGWQIYDLFV